jgi:hypothetical protein
LVSRSGSVAVSWTSEIPSSPSRKMPVSGKAVRIDAWDEITN